MLLRVTAAAGAAAVAAEEGTEGAENAQAKLEQQLLMKWLQT